MTVATVLTLIAAVLAFVSFFDQRYPFLPVAVLLVCVALLTGQVIVLD